jgi:peptide deformylase
MNNKQYNLILEPSEILKTKCILVEDFSEIKNIANSMIKIMEENNGIGISAPQIGLSIQLFVMFIKETMSQPKVFVNPKIKYGCVSCTEEEGCLSIPNIKVKIQRNKFIIVEYQDENGNKLSKNFSNLEARCIQHEIDHLNGILISDKVI